jgi:hypothetical protein
LLSLSLCVFASQALADDARFKADLETLTKADHRLAGTPEGQAAGEHIENRLREAGVDHVLPLSFRMWQTFVERCTLDVGGTQIELQPLRPNVIANPVTEQDGITGPMFYVGKGELND